MNGVHNPIARSEVLILLLVGEGFDASNTGKHRHPEQDVFRAGGEEAGERNVMG